MTETQEQPEAPTPKPQRKACQIQIMFPVADDLKALEVKHAIDDIVGDIPDKRYTFNITEM